MIGTGTNFRPLLPRLVPVNPTAEKKKAFRQKRGESPWCRNSEGMWGEPLTRYSPLKPSFFHVLVKQSIGPLNLVI